MMDVILACPNYDTATEAEYNFITNIYLPYTQNLGIFNIHTALDSDCIFDYVHDLSKNNRVAGIFELGHGGSSTIVGDDSDEYRSVWYKNEYYGHGEDIAGKIVYFFSCSSGNLLGPWLITKGARGFIGFNDLAYVSSNVPYQEGVGEPWYALCEGDTVQEAYQRAYDKWNYWYQQRGGMYLLANRDHLCWHGASSATLFDESEFCNWLTDKDGINILLADIFVLVDSYLDNTPPAGYSFIPTMKEIFGVVDYYLGFIDSGNIKTGCDF